MKLSSPADLVRLGPFSRAHYMKKATRWSYSGVRAYYDLCASLTYHAFRMHHETACRTMDLPVFIAAGASAQD